MVLFLAISLGVSLILLCQLFSGGHYIQKQSWSDTADRLKIDLSRSLNKPMIETLHFSATGGMTDKLNSIPLISNAALQKLRQASQSEQKTEVLRAQVIGTHALPAGKDDPALKYQLLLQIGQQQVKTLSNQNWPAGSELKVQLQPDQTLKVLGLVPASNQSLDQASSQRLNSLLTQLLANRIPVSEQQSTHKLVQNLNQVLDTALGQNPSADHAVKHLTQGVKHWLQNLPSIEQLRQPHNPNQQLTTPIPARQADAGIAANALTEKTLSEKAQLTRQLLNNSGVFAESKLLQGIQAQQVGKQSAPGLNERFQNLQRNFQQALNDLGTAAPIKTAATTATKESNPTANSTPSSLTQDLRQALRRTLNILQTAGDSNSESKTTGPGQIPAPTSKAPGLHPAGLNPSVIKPSELKPSGPAALTLTQTGLASTSQHNSLPGNAEKALQPALDGLLNTDNKLTLAKLLASNQERSQFIPAVLPTLQENSAQNSNDGQLIRLLQTLFSQIEREQFSQLQSFTSNNSDQNSPNLQWFPLLLNHNAHMHNVDLFLERQPYQQDGEEKSWQWQINLHFELENLGQLAVELTMVQQQCQAKFWSEETTTLQLLSQHLQPLRQRLSDAGIAVEELQVRHGTLARKRQQISQRLVDIRT